MGVGAGRAVRPWKPIEGAGRGARASGQWSGEPGLACCAGGGRLRRRRAPGSSQFESGSRRPASAQVSRAGSQVLLRAGRGLGRKLRWRDASWAAVGAAPHLQRLRGSDGGLGGERSGWREREVGCPRWRGSPRRGSVAPKGRGLSRGGGGVPMVAGSRVFVRAPLGA